MADYLPQGPIDKRITEENGCKSQDTCVNVGHEGLLLAFCSDVIEFNWGHLQNQGCRPGNFNRSFPGLWLARARVVPILNIYNKRLDEVARAIKNLQLKEQSAALLVFPIPNCAADKTALYPSTINCDFVNFP